MYIFSYVPKVQSSQIHAAKNWVRGMSKKEQASGISLRGYNNGIYLNFLFQNKNCINTSFEDRTFPVIQAKKKARNFT